MFRASGAKASPVSPEVKSAPARDPSVLAGKKPKMPAKTNTNHHFLARCLDKI